MTELVQLSQIACEVDQALRSSSFPSTLAVSPCRATRRVRREGRLRSNGDEKKPGLLSLLSEIRVLIVKVRSLGTKLFVVLER